MTKGLPIHTERLIISEFTSIDAPFILALLNTPGWLEFIGDRGIKNTDDAKTYLVNGPIRSYQTYGFGLYKVSLTKDHMPIGMCGLIKRDILEDVDIGFAFLSEYAKYGYAYEAALATLNYAKESLRIARVVAITNKDNVKSISLLNKLGLTFERNIKLPNEKEEIMLFSIQMDPSTSSTWQSL